LFMMCSMARLSWCALHQIRKKEQSSCIKSWSRVTTPTGHISSFVRRQTKKTNLSIMTKYCQEVRSHFKHDFTRMPLEHWWHTSMQVGDGVMFFHVHMDTQVKIRCALVGNKI
jgi:hypothetical protein